MRKNVRKAIASIGVSALVVSSMLLPVSATTTTSTSTAKKMGLRFNGNSKITRIIIRMYVI